MNAAILLEMLMKMSLSTDLTKIPILYCENVDGISFISQAEHGEIQLLNDVQELPESFNVELNTQVDMGLFIGTFPKID